MRCLNKRFARCKRVWTLSTLIGKESDDNVKDVKKRHETFADVVRAPLGRITATIHNAHRHLPLTPPQDSRQKTLAMVIEFF